MPKRKPATPEEQVQWLRDHMNYDGERCLRWPFGYDQNVGRGRLVYDGVPWWAHRLMCTFVKGPAPADKPQAAHSCGNGHMGCVHPKHLDWSTQSDNHKDRRKHGTAATNRWGPVGKLTREQIDGIRAAKGNETQMETARRFNISHANVRYWQGSTHYPAELSTEPKAIARRQRAASRRALSRCG